MNQESTDKLVEEEDTSWKMGMGISARLSPVQIQSSIPPHPQSITGGRDLSILGEEKDGNGREMDSPCSPL